MKKRQHTQSLRQAGLAYVEALLAVLLLAACMAPALQSIGDALRRQAALSEGSTNLSCLLAAMDQTVAASFGTLRAVATSQYSNGVFSSPVALYSKSASSACPHQRNVYILRYHPFSNPAFGTGSDMLYVRVEQADGLKTATLVVAPAR